MELYAWTGRSDLAMRITANFDDSEIIFMTSGEEALLLKESNSDSALPSDTARYKVLNAVGNLNLGAFAVLNNIPVSEEGKEVFESRFSNRAGLVEKEPGFVAIRVLRPLNSDTYVILTMWRDESAFKKWQNSPAYGNAHAKRGTAAGIDKQSNILIRPSYITTYYK